MYVRKNVTCGGASEICGCTYGCGPPMIILHVPLPSVYIDSFDMIGMIFFPLLIIWDE